MTPGLPISVAEARANLGTALLHAEKFDDATLHLRRAVALRPRAITVDEVRELRDEIRLALACEGRNLARTVPPGLPSVTRGAVFQVQHHAVRHVRGEPRGLRGEVRSCGRRGQQRTQHQHGAARHPQSYVGVWHDRSAALSTGTAR